MAATSTASQSLLDGKLDTVANIAKQKTGKRPSPPTVWRWVKKGLRGGEIKLAAHFHSGIWHTTAEAFDHFLAEQTAYAMRSESQESDEATDDDLRSEGLL